MDVLDDLQAEHERLEALLAPLSDEQWDTPSAAEGWSVADVVLHLAQTEEAVAASAAQRPLQMWSGVAGSVDDVAESAVRTERAGGPAVLARWQAARRAALAALRAADPKARLPWVTGTLTPRALGTTRLAEHWAHGLDIAGPLGLPFPDTTRLRHVAWLGHRTLPYAFQVAGLEPREVACELTGPDGDTWSFGDLSCGAVIRGAAGEFCRVGAHRLTPDETSLVAEGPDAQAALRVLRNYAA